MPNSANDNANKPAAGRAAGTARPCPICAKPAVEAYRPFCSKRCADVDLARWLNGSYAVPATETEEDDGLEDSGESGARE